jgi:hypothetical protein
VGTTLRIRFQGSTLPKATTGIGVVESAYIGAADSAENFGRAARIEIPIRNPSIEAIAAASLLPRHLFVVWMSFIASSFC